VAELEVKGGELILRLSVIEKTEAVHGDLHIPLSAVRNVDVLDDAHEMTRVKIGLKVGMRIPGRASVAVVRRDGRKIFVAVHHETPRAVRVRLDGDSYDEWIVGATNPESVIANLNLNIES
jgi:uncharacterized protein